MAAATADASAPKLSMAMSPTTRTSQPIVTGSSVVALKYAGGVMMASDTLASYGSMARFPDVRRLRKISEQVLVGGSGELSDFDYITRLLTELKVENDCAEDSGELDALEVHSYLTRVMYNRRNKMNPLWNDLVVAGIKGGKPVLGTVDKIGTAFEADYVATGLGKHMAIPLIRERWTPTLTEGQARALLEECMRVLFYRDCHTINRIQIARVSTDGDAVTSTVSEPFSLDTEWSYEAFTKAKAGSGGSW